MMFLDRDGKTMKWTKGFIDGVEIGCSFEGKFRQEFRHTVYLNLAL
jgi:hypothetical protein